ncbi:MAG: hypothetical protein KDC26_11625 [Armatimonadetes bacterium]|nr:hypothetical protein [Armatimonadota bacterium]
MSLIASVLCASLVSQQQPFAQNMIQFEKWVGTWEGSGWQMAGETKQEFKSIETIRKQSGGAVYIIEAKHWFDEAGKPNNVFFDVFGTFTFDREQKKHLLSMYYPNGTVPVYELTMKDNGFVWNIPLRDNSYAMSVEFDGDTWKEAGYMTQDGKKRQMFELNMKRK